MLIVKIKEGESIDKALKRLKYKVMKSKQNELLYKNREYKKKSVIEREQKNRAQYNEKRKSL
jgi:small subunit ribosomal protein S21